jgi:hypothetical protein
VQPRRLDRIDMCRELVFPRMVYLRGAFGSHLDVINLCRSGISFQDGSSSIRATY